MQGVVDIKDNSLIVRFKFMARPKNPSLVQRMAIRRMYETFPALGIQFATANYPFAIAAPPVAPSPPAVAPPFAPSPPATAPEASLPPPAPAKAAE
jgi:moderate conductance mechanosensitive channel